MARPSDQTIQVIKDKSTLVMEYGASQTITGSPINSREVKEKVIIVETSDGDDSIKSTQTCISLFKIEWEKLLPSLCQTVLFVKGLPQDLRGCKSVNREHIRVFRMSIQTSAGCFHWTRSRNNITKTQSSLLVRPLIYLQTKDMDRTTYNHLNRRTTIMY